MKLSPDSGGGGHVDDSLCDFPPGVGFGGLALIRHSRNISFNGLLLQVKSIGNMSSSLVTPEEVLGISKVIGETSVLLTGDELTLSKVDENKLIFSGPDFHDTPAGVGIQLLSSKGGLPARNGLVEGGTDWTGSLAAPCQSTTTSGRSSPCPP